MLPYVPAGRDLETKSISLDATHTDADGNTLYELDVHSTYGFYEVKATSEWFMANKKRPMIISRSSLPGMGKHGSRWLGDNFSDIDYLSYSIPGIIQSGMYGIPLAGVDICGFNGKTTAELCARWSVVGAMYPFSRNHNGFGNPDQYPYTYAKDRYEEGVSYMDVIAQGIRNKYSLLRYMYSELIKLSSTGGQLHKPVFYEYPGDAQAWEDNHNTWLIGDALKVSANTDTLNKNSTDIYFPDGYWCNVFDDSCMVSRGDMKTLRTKAYDIYAHLAYGHMIPFNENKDLVSIAGLQATVPVSFKANPWIL